MQIADFDTASMHNHQLFRDARIAMLTHRVLFHLEMTAASVGEVEQALEEFAEATNERTGETIASRPGFLRLDAGETLGL